MGFWENKRVIVTGGAGFLGSNIVTILEAKGCNTVMAPRSVKYDLRERDAIHRLLADTHPDIVIHAAGVVGGIGGNQAEPGRYFYDNLMMGVQLLEACRTARVEKFVGVGTICSYPKFTPVPFQEEDLWNGYPEETNAPYGLAKKMLIVQAQAYRQQYGYNAINVLPVNLYGPGDNFDERTSHVIPALIRRCEEATVRGESELVCWGDGSPTREFLYVEDAAAGIVAAAERYNDPAPINLGSGMEITIKTLAETIARLTGFAGHIAWDTSKPNGQPRRRVDASKAEQRFGWRATTSFEEGLRLSVEWFRKHLGVLNT